MPYKPYSPIDWSGRIDVEAALDKGIWPPQAMTARRNRLVLYQDLFDGEWAQVSEDDLRVQVNYFRRIPVGLADILSMSPPQTGDLELDEAISEAAYDGVISMLRSGAALFWTNPETGDPEVLDPRYWFPGVEGWVYAVPLLSPGTGLTDRLDVRYQTGEVFTQTVYAFAGQNIGRVIETQSFRMPDTLALVRNRPVTSGWGGSVADQLASAVVEVSDRYSKIGAVLDKFVKPLLTFRVASSELPDLAPDITDEDSWVEVQEKVDKVFSGIADQDVIELQDEVQDVTALTWDPRLETALDQIQALQQDIETLASMPGLHTGFSEAGMSGIAIKRILIPLYAHSRSLQIRLVQGLNKSLAAAGVNAVVDWPHPFDVLEEAGEQPEERIVE